MKYIERDDISVGYEDVYEQLHTWFDTAVKKRDVDTTDLMVIINVNRYRSIGTFVNLQTNFKYNDSEWYPIDIRH